jgi:hypothetical protein
MIVIFSGEGPSDLGKSATGTSPCCGADFIPGPMAALVDNAIEARFDYSLFAPGMVSAWFIAETVLAQHAKDRSKRSVAFRGSKQPDAETAYFYINAEMLGLFAKEKEQEFNDKSIAVLFRDHDGTRSALASLWASKAKSIADGFKRAQYNRGVAMLPKPKSEAWLLCVAKNQTPHDCAKLEDLPGNDAAPYSAKQQLNQAHGRHLSATELYEWVKQSKPDFDHLNAMPSFARFNKDLNSAFTALK